MSQRAPSYQRSFAGFFGSLIVLLLVVGAFVAFRDANRGDVPDPVRAIDYTSGVATFRAEADFALLAPPSLPQGWIATSIRFTNSAPQAWHLGLLTEDRDYVGLEQATESVAAMVQKHVDDEATREGVRTIDGEEWEAYTDDAGDNALVRQVDTLTTLVVSPLPFEDLEAFVRSLED